MNPGPDGDGDLPLTTQSGKHKGLTVLLDAHTDMVTAGTVSEDFQAIVTS